MVLRPPSLIARALKAKLRSYEQRFEMDTPNFLILYRSGELERVAEDWERDRSALRCWHRWAKLAMLAGVLEDPGCLK